MTGANGPHLWPHGHDRFGPTRQEHIENGVIVVRQWDTDFGFWFPICRRCGNGPLTDGEAGICDEC